MQTNTTATRRWARGAAIVAALAAGGIGGAAFAEAPPPYLSDGRQYRATNRTGGTR